MLLGRTLRVLLWAAFCHCCVAQYCAAYCRWDIMNCRTNAAACGACEICRAPGAQAKIAAVIALVAAVDAAVVAAVAAAVLARGVALVAERLARREGGERPGRHGRGWLRGPTRRRRPTTSATTTFA